MRAKHRVHTSEDFHPSAYSRDPDRYLKYAGLTAAAAVTAGLGLATWQARPWEIKSKATKLATPEPSTDWAITKPVWDERQQSPRYFGATQTVDGAARNYQ